MIHSRLLPRGLHHYTPVTPVPVPSTSSAPCPPGPMHYPRPVHSLILGPWPRPRAFGPSRVLRIPRDAAFPRCAGPSCPGGCALLLETSGLLP